MTGVWIWFDPMGSLRLLIKTRLFLRLNQNQWPGVLEEDSFQDSRYYIKVLRDESTGIYQSDREKFKVTTKCEHQKRSGYLVQQLRPHLGYPHPISKCLRNKKGDLPPADSLPQCPQQPELDQAEARSHTVNTGLPRGWEGLSYHALPSQGLYYKEGGTGNQESKHHKQLLKHCAKHLPLC